MIVEQNTLFKTTDGGSVMAKNITESTMLVGVSGDTVRVDKVANAGKQPCYVYSFYTKTNELKTFIGGQAEIACIKTIDKTYPHYVDVYYLRGGYFTPLYRFGKELYELPRRLNPERIGEKECVTIVVPEGVVIENGILIK